MNITADLVAFFTLKNRRLNDDRLKMEDEEEEESEEDPDSLQASTTPKTYSLFEPSVNYLLGGYLSLIIVVSVIANILVILVMSLRKRKFRSTHIFIVALSVSDTLFSLAIHPMLIATSFGVNPHELFGEYGCNWYGFGAVFFGSLSMAIHGAVAFTRYRVIVHSSDDFWHKMRNNLLALAAIIVAAFSIAIAPVLGWGRYETFEYGCTLAFHDPSFNQRSYSLFAMITMMTIPLGLCIYCYTRIICFTYQCKLELFMSPGENDTSFDNNDPLQRYDPNEEQKMDEMMRKVDPTLMAAVSLMERKLTRLTLVAALGFMLAWLPFSLLCFWEMLSPPDEIPGVFRVVSCLFCKTATAYNPFIYFFMGKEFRQDCRCVLEQLWFRTCHGGQDFPSNEIYMGETLSPQNDRHKICHPRLDRSGKFRQARRGSSSGPLKDTVLTAKIGSNSGIIENPFERNESHPRSRRGSNRPEHMKMERRNPEKSNSSDDIMETIFADLNEFGAALSACKDQQTSTV